jgi:hypothetical protein
MVVLEHRDVLEAGERGTNVGHKHYLPILHLQYAGTDLIDRYASYNIRITQNDKHC